MKKDYGKPRMDLIDPDWLLSVGAALAVGQDKYPPGNWLNLSKDEHMGAVLRHIMAHMKGELIDPDTGIEHLAHASSRIMFICAIGRLERDARLNANKC